MLPEEELSRIVGLRSELGMIRRCMRDLLRSTLYVP